MLTNVCVRATFSGFLEFGMFVVEGCFFVVFCDYTPLYIGWTYAFNIEF